MKARTRKTDGSAFSPAEWLNHAAASLTEHAAALLRRAIKGPAEGWMTFILVLASVLVTMSAVRSGQWVPTPGLYSLALYGIVMGFMLAKARGSGWLLLPTGLSLGVAVSLCQLTSLSEGMAFVERLTEVASRLFAWWNALVEGGTSTDTLAFSFFLVLGSWVVGFLAAWSVFRRQNIWGAVLPGAIVIVGTLTNLFPGDQMVYLYLYLFVALLLVVRLVALKRQHEWDCRGIQQTSSGLRSVMRDALSVAVPVVLLAYVLPMEPARVYPLSAVWDSVSYPVRAMEQEFGRVLHGVPARRAYQSHVFGTTQVFGGGRASRREPVLMMEAPFPVYLRARSYDIYMHRGWTTSGTRLVSPEWRPEQYTQLELNKLQEVSIEITSFVFLRVGDALYVGGYPIDMSTGYQLEVMEPARYVVPIFGTSLGSPAETQQLPVDLREAVERLRELSEVAAGRSMTESEIRSVLPDDLQLLSWRQDSGRVEEIVVERLAPVPADVLAIGAAESVDNGGSYRVDTYVSVALQDDLREAGTGYPGWVLDRYLQLPDTVPSRVTGLAEFLTQEAENPYDKAVAIRDYLRTLEYTREIEAPPDGTDGVDYFLFVLEKGYCQYFASAMTVLLRACGVPSRMVVGYGPGHLIDQDRSDREIDWPDGWWATVPSTYVVWDSHNWSEVFFPGYGWIPFEPTPSYPIVSRTIPAVPGDPEGNTDVSLREGDDMGVPPSGGADADPSPKETEDPVMVVPCYVWLAGMLAASALLVVIMRQLWKRLLGRVTEPRVAYWRIGRLAALSRLSPRSSCTPYEYGRTLAAALPDISVDIDSVVDTYVRAYYGRARLTADDGARVADAWPRVRNGLLRRALRGLVPLRLPRGG